MRAELDARLLAARLPPLTPRSPDDWAARAERHRSALAAASDAPIAFDEDPRTGDRSPISVRDLIRSEISDEAQAIAVARGDEVAGRFFEAAIGDGMMIGAASDQWLAELDLAGQRKAQTVAGHRVVLKHLGDHLKAQGWPSLAVVPMSAIRLKVAAGFVDSRHRSISPKTGRPITIATVQREVSSMSVLWRWARRRGGVEANPWEDQTAGLGGPRVAPTDGMGEEDGAKRPYRPDELVALLRADGAAWAPNGGGYGQTLWDAVRLALLTGCRANELASLRVRDVTEGGAAIVIRAGKTANAKRVVPLCAPAQEVIRARLVDLGEVPPEAPLWPEVPALGADERRGKMLSTRFGTARKRVLPGDPVGIDFHSLRRSFAAGLRDAMDQGAGSTITPNIIAALMGHTGANMALTVYAPGALEAVKRKAVEAMVTLGFDPSVRAVLAETAGSRPRRNK